MDQGPSVSCSSAPLAARSLQWMLEFHPTRMYHFGFMRPWPHMETSAAGMVSHSYDDRNDELWNEVAQPHGCGFGKPDLADGYESPNASKEDAQGEKVDQKALLTNGECSPQANYTSGEVHACHEAVDIVQARGRIGLSEIHLKRATKHGNGCHQE
jgi:hypothetical protein